jgi:hypothetical protein
MMNVLTAPISVDGPADATIERDRLRVVVATILINVVCVGLLALAPWSSWRTGAGLNLIDNALLVGFVIVRRDRFLANLMVFGLAVGFVELASDAWLVDVLRTLDYSNGVDGAGWNPMIWRSPVWMPFAWQVVAVQFGYLGLRLYERLGWRGLLVVGVLGAINIPYYEEMALRIHWWRYRDCAMLMHTPWAIIVGEFLIAMYLGYAARWTRAGRFGRSLMAGVMAGGAIFVGDALPYWVISWWV